MGTWAVGIHWPGRVNSSVSLVPLTVVNGGYSTMREPESGHSNAQCVGESGGPSWPGESVMKMKMLM